MALWLLARAVGAALPRRLVYVVDRRAVVDQATEFAEQLHSALQKAEGLGLVRSKLGLDHSPLAISTLRGRYVDNREWMADPGAPAIIVGTVDMVGSRLLFEGYGVSQRMRPYAAGLMGCDSLVILDEAHLAHPFEQLLRKIEQEQRPMSENEPHLGSGIFAGSDASQKLPPPFRVLPLSATMAMGNDTTSGFGINNADRGDETVRLRLDATKALSIEDLPEKSALHEKLSEKAWQLIHGESSTVTTTGPVRMLIYCDLRSDAEKTANALQKCVKEEKCKDPVLLFVGGRRVHERKQAADEMKRYGFIGDSCEGDAPVFVVATSAGEVGVDLDAHHMVCDLVSWERMVQRLGRVNRRGISQTKVLIIDQSKNQKKEDQDKQNRLKATRKLLESLAKDSDGFHQAGPAALLNLREQPIYRECISEALTRPPLYPALTRPLVDSWSMTSLDEDAGRPEVSPWLRGWVKDEAQTTIVWRQYLPVLFSDSDQVPRKHAKAEVTDFFEAAPPQTEELLEVEVSHAVQWLKKRVSQIRSRFNTSDCEVNDDMVAPMREGAPVVFLLDRRNRLISILTSSEINIKKTDDLRRDFANRQIIVDSRIGGIKEGLLNNNSNDAACTIEDNWKKLDHENLNEHEWPVRVRTLREAERAKKLGDSEIPKGGTDNTIHSWREALAIPYYVSHEGDTKVWLVVEQRPSRNDGEEGKAISSRAQHLDEHQAWAAEEAAKLVDKISLDKDDRMMLMAAVAAAQHHDDGKKALRWQRAFNASREDGPYAKTVGPFNRYVLNGYRHELKSALDAETNGLDGIDRSDPRFELSLHLIASHHGYARPSISIKGYDDLPPSETAKRVHDIALRFARLQRKWGPWGLAWWEALVRAADQRASRRLDQKARRERAQPDLVTDLQPQGLVPNSEVMR